MKKVEILKATSAKEAERQAREEILLERQNKQLGLKVRWNSLNIANRKYFRFKNIYLLALGTGDC